MDSPRKLKQEEVTGVSRSGRVRKKSSKLMDFESPDEIDIRISRKKDKNDLLQTPIGGVKSNSKRPFHLKQDDLVIDEVNNSLGHIIQDMEGGSGYIKDEVLSEESEPETGTAPQYNQNEDSSFDSLGSEEDVNELEVESGEAEGFQAIATDSPDELPSQSLYMMEKSNKKKLVIKDGKIVGRLKSQRKDKGKSRFTAYLLWANEMRPEVARTEPDLDFSQMSKRLGELWASVSSSEKYMWKRRAKRMAVKAELEAGDRKGKGSGSPLRKYVNKNQAARQASHTPPAQPFENRANAKVNLLLDANSSVFKQVATTPLDVAAHLKLLGESLTVIGERLTEAEGHLAVSGSYSLLLDSLLCALVPLLCLTQQLPELNCLSQDSLSQSMDNIAYIMPM